jgi:branched-chain amino acid transport system permease protein
VIRRSWAVPAGLVKGRSWAVPAGLVALALAIVVPLVVQPFFVDILTRVLVFAILAMGLNLLVGYTGLPSLGQAAFLAMGAYTLAILVKRTDMGHLPAVLLAIVAAGLLGAGFGALALRARGATFLLITLALAQSAWAVAFTWRAMTGGDDGMGGLVRPRLAFLPWSLDDARVYYFVVLAVFLLVLWGFHTLVRSPFGLALQGIRDNELRMQSLGYNTWLYQYAAFIIAAVLAGIAGVLRAYLTGAVTPGWAEVTPSAEALLMVIMGGPGTVFGPIIGAAIIVPAGQIANFFTTRWMLVLGVIYVAVVLFAPEGIIGAVRRRLVREDRA